MAKGTTIEKLFLSLGLDMTALDADLLTASKTVNQGMADLKTKSSQAKLRMEIDMTQFKGAENSAEALTAKTKHLTDQLTIQKQAVSLMNAAYADSVAEKGKDDAVSQRILTRLLREQKAEADLAAQIRQTNAARTGGVAVPSVNTVATNSASTAINTLTGSIGRARDVSQMAGNQILALNKKMIGLAAVAATGYGLFDYVKGVVDAGDAIYKLSMRMNLTTVEAVGLNKILGMAGVDTQAFITTMTKLDRSTLAAGKNGNALTDSMKLFNFSLTDASGSLLPMNQQLEQLAIGYQNAAKAGEEESFAAEVLGAKGAALIPLLLEYNDLKEVSARTKTFGGIDPKQAHEMALEMKVLNAEAGQFKNVLGVALMPIAKEVIPSIESGLGTVVTVLKDNKQNLIDIADITVDVLKGFKDVSNEVINIVSPAIKTLFDTFDINKDTPKKALKELQVEMRTLQNNPVTMSVDTLLGPLKNVPGWKDKIANLKSEATAQIDLENQTAANRITEQNKINAENKKNTEESKKLAENQANAIIQARRKEMDTAKANAKAEIELADEVYRSTHTVFENELHDIDVKRDKLIADGVSESTALEISVARKKIIIDKNNKEIQKSIEDMDSQIYKLSHTSLENRLRDIELERKVWIEKTHDEVKATQLAEQEKQKAIQDTINSQQSEEIRAVKEAIKTGKSLSDAYKEAHAKRLEDENAQAKAEAYVRNQSGVYLPGDTKSSTVIDGNSAYQLNEIVKEFTYNLDKLNPSNNITNRKIENNITISVPVAATINNDTDVNILADKVADKIKTPIINALAGDDNSY